MCGKNVVASASASSAPSDGINSTLYVNYATAEMRMDDYFFLDPLFIIGMLVLFVILVIIWSWWSERRKLAAEANDVEKNQPQKARTVEITEKNLEVLEDLLNTVAINDDVIETESLLENPEKGKKHTTFGPSTKQEDGTNMDGSEDPPPNPATDKIITIIPDVDFRDFPKTEHDCMKMRRANMKKMLSLPPMT